jgi:hypothetical protein
MLSRLIRLLHKFDSAIEGKVASIFAFALIPIIAIVAAAADYNPANAVSAAMPSALDLVGPPLQRTVQTVSTDQLQSFPTYKYQLAIFLSLDGVNTQDLWHISQSQIDVGQKMIWDNIKTAAITPYPIQIDSGDGLSSTLPKNGTGNTPGTGDHYFLLKSANESLTTFSHSTTNLSQLYLEK